LAEGGLLGRIAHPVEARDVLAHRLEDRLDEHARGLLRRAGKVLVAVLLAEKLAEPERGRVDAALVALLSLFDGAQHLLELERFVVERLGQLERPLLDEVIGEVALPLLGRELAAELVERREELRRADAELRAGRKIERLEVGLPVDGL